MGGGLMQLVAYGAQDVYLTGNPQITFWKVTYRRHTNFAMESIEQTFNGQADFGNRVVCTISRNGDLAYRVYLEVTLPKVKPGASAVARWLDYPGEHLIEDVSVEIGGQRIDRQYGSWMHIWNQLTMTSEQERGYHKMVGQTTALTYLTDNKFSDVATACTDNVATNVCQPRNALPETTLYVPLQFWFCRNPGLALPLIALQYHEVKININFRAVNEMLWHVTGTASGVGDKKAASVETTSMAAASLFVDYIFLDTDERRRMAQSPHEYLIEQLQDNGLESVGSTSNKIRLNFNHPCKELVFTVQKDEHVNYCNSFKGDKQMFLALGAQPFNYTDTLDALPNSILAFGTEGSVGSGDYINSTALFHDSAAVFGTTSFPASANDWLTGGGAGGDFRGEADVGAREVVGVSDAGTFVLSETALHMHCWGENPVVTARLQLNGQDRMSDREGSYYDVVQPFQHHTRTPDTGINVYSFALRHEEHQPSGTCNMSRIDNATLQLILSSNTVSTTETAKVRVWATNYNVLRIMSGMGGLAYSN